MEAFGTLLSLESSSPTRDQCALTFDMRGGPKSAKRPLERPLDGGVSRHRKSHFPQRCFRRQALACRPLHAPQLQ